MAHQLWNKSDISNNNLTKIRHYDLILHGFTWDLLAHPIRKIIYEIVLIKSSLLDNFSSPM